MSELDNQLNDSTDSAFGDEVEEAHGPSIEMLVQNSLVKVYNDHVVRDHIRPWRISKRESSSGTGYVISINDENFILTNAHCVMGSTLLQVMAYGSAKKYKAELVFVMPACDLAIISVEEKKFWEYMIPMNIFDRIPQSLETVFVIGYPLGDMCGNNISFTRGVVSRLLSTTYEVHGYVENVAIQIDAAINPGNSGGPVVDEMGLVIGTAFQGFDDAENMGQIIPISVFKNLFLTYYKKYGHLDAADRAKYAHQVPELGINWQKMESQDMRDYYQMDEDQTGILVTNVWPLSNLAGVIYPNDVITHINGINVESNGTIRFPENDKIYLSHKYLITNHPPGMACTLGIYRKGKKMEINVIPMYVPKPIEGTMYESSNQYLIIGGLVFVCPSIQYLKQLAEEHGVIHPYLHAILFETDRDEEDHDYIIMSAILQNEVNMGYEHKSFVTYPLTHFNGERVSNLGHLAKLYDENKETFMKFEFQSALDKSNRTIILNSKKVKDLTLSILEENMIASDRSKDLK
jgi:S1-C subfamily serine protease